MNVILNYKIKLFYFKDSLQILSLGVPIFRVLLLIYFFNTAVQKLNAGTNPMASNFPKLQDTQEDKGDQSVQICDPCSGDEVQAPAEAFCEVCSQHFCKSCLKFHERNRTTMTHRVEQIRHSKIAADKTSSSSNEKDFIQLKCGSHPSENLEYFCEKHKVVTCPTCNLVDHRQCDIVTISEKIAERSFDDNAQKTLTDAQDLLAKFEELEVKYKNYASETKRQREVTAKKSAAKKHQFNKCLNDLESMFNNLADKEIKNLETKCTDINNIRSVIQKQTEDYQRILKLGSNEEKRILTMVVEADIKNYCENFDENRQNCFTISEKLVFQKLDSINQKLTNLGDSIYIEKVPVGGAFHDKVAAVGEMDINAELGMSKLKD